MLYDPLNVSEERLTLNSWQESRPDVVWLAMLASLARRVEPELLRALRFSLGDYYTGTERLTTGSEAALWVSPFVESRGPDGLAFLPEYLSLLRNRLQQQPNDLLEHAWEVLKTTHAVVAPVIQWEQELTYLGLSTKVLEVERRQQIQRLIQQARKAIVTTDRRGLEQWVGEMGSRVPEQPDLRRLLAPLQSLVMTRAISSNVGESQVDFAALPKRTLQLGVQGEKLQIGHRVKKPVWRLMVPAIEPVILQILSEQSDAAWETLVIPFGGTVEVVLEQEILLRSVDGQSFRVNASSLRDTEGEADEEDVASGAVLPHFVHEIFVSYRGHDNHEGWVTQLVDQLQKVLRTLIKGPQPSLYFDQNFDDELRENNLVDQSLDSRIKSLILLPIVSHAYCDPMSYSWKMEFLPFLANAQSDGLGLGVHLANGQVVSRVLPVRIHRLERDDEKAFENELGSHFRAIDFVYTEGGGSRPLLPEDDAKRYRDQLNQLAHAKRHT